MTPEMQLGSLLEYVAWACGIAAAVMIAGTLLAFERAATAFRYHCLIIRLGLSTSGWSRDVIRVEFAEYLRAGSRQSRKAHMTELLRALESYMASRSPKPAGGDASLTKDDQSGVEDREIRLMLEQVSRDMASVLLERLRVAESVKLLLVGTKYYA